MSGEVELASTTVAVVKGLVDGKKLKIVGVLAHDPIAGFGDVPTLAKAGVESDLILPSDSYLVFPRTPRPT